MSLLSGLDTFKSATYWKSSKSLGKGFAVAYPADAAAVAAYADALTTNIDAPVPTAGLQTLHAQGLVEMLRAAAHLDPAPSPPPPPPPTNTKLYGISPSNDNGYTASIDTQLNEYIALGATFPRIPADTAFADAAKAKGIKKWVAWMTGDGSATPAALVAYAQRYPEAVVVEFGNELNLGGWKVADVAAKQIQVFNAFKDANLDPMRVGLSAIGNSASSAEHLLPLDWCRGLRSHGCVKGTGFGIADYHMYHLDPVGYDKWMHVTTPDPSGESCQTVLGHPQFVVTEFGCKIGWTFGGVTVDENLQAQAATAWVKWFNAQPELLGAHWFQAFDGSQWPNFGLIDASGRRRPSYAAYKLAISTVALPAHPDQADEFFAAKRAAA